MNVQDGTSIAGAIIALQSAGNEHDALQFNLSDYVMVSQDVVIDTVISNTPPVNPDFDLTNVFEPMDELEINETKPNDGDDFIRQSIEAAVAEESPDLEKDTSQPVDFYTTQPAIINVIPPAIPQTLPKAAPVVVSTESPELRPSESDLSANPVVLRIDTPAPSQPVTSSPFQPRVLPARPVPEKVVISVNTSEPRPSGNVLPSAKKVTRAFDTVDAGLDLVAPEPAITNIMSPFRINELSLDSLPVSVEATDKDVNPVTMPVTSKESNKPAVAEARSSDSVIKPQQVPEFEPVILNAMDRVPAPVVQEIKDADTIPQKMAICDIAMNNLASFINKNISIPEGSGFKTSPNSLSVSRDSYSNVERKSDLISSQYSVGDAGAALKIETYTAKIKVYPPDLGQVTAEILINKGMTELTLTAESRHVKEFIETNLHQLRETFLDSNINLGQVTVQNNAAQEKNDFNRHQTSRWTDWGEVIQGTDEPLKQEIRRQSDSMVDTYI